LVRFGVGPADVTSLRTFVRVVAIPIVVLSLALLAGCGSSGPTGDTSAAPLLLAVDDLRPLVTISPDATGWPWHVDPQTRVASPSFKLDQSDPSYPIQKALSDAYQDAGLVKSATSSWFDGKNGKKASSFANLVATTAEATSALEAEHEFARAWFPEFEHQEVRDIGADGVGEQSWAVRGGTDNAGFVEIGWTRANAVLSVYLTCNPCDSDIADAARRWAERIDDAAHTAAG
jgi:hypothetical protein